MRVFVLDGTNLEVSAALDDLLARNDSCAGQDSAFNLLCGGGEDFGDGDVGEPPRTDTPDDPGDGPGKDGGVAPPEAPPLETSSTVTRYEDPGQPSCGPRLKVTFRFKDGKRVGSTVEKWEYDANCILLRYTRWDFDADGKRTGVTVSGRKVVQPSKKNRRRKITKFIRFVFGSDPTKPPQKFRVTRVVITDEKDRVVQETEQIEPVP